MRNIVRNEITDIRWKFTIKLGDLDFVADITLISSENQHIQKKTKDQIIAPKGRDLKPTDYYVRTTRINANQSEQRKHR